MSLSARLDIDMLLKVPVPTKPLFDLDSNEVKSRGRGQSKYKWMYVVSEYGIYEALKDVRSEVLIRDVE